MARKKIIYFRDSMKAVLDAERTVVVDDSVSNEQIEKLMHEGYRVVNRTNVNWMMEEEEKDDAE